MHTCASNSELVKPLPEPKLTLNRRLHQQYKRVPLDQRNYPPQHPRIVYLPILNINYFRHFHDVLRNYDPMDDEPIWAVNHVVASTPGSIITILETSNKFAVKDTKNEAIRLMMFPLSLNGEAKTWLGELNEGTIETLSTSQDKVLLNLDWDKNQKTKSSLKKTIAFTDEGSSNSKTDKTMTRMDAMTIKMDAQYKELQSHAKQPTPDLDDDDTPMSREEEDKFMQTFRKTYFYNDYRDRDSNRDNWRSSRRNDYNRDKYQSNTDDKSYDLQRQFNDFMKSQQSTNAFVKETFMDLKTQLKTVAKNHQASIQNLKTKFDRLADKQLVDLLDLFQATLNQTHKVTILKLINNFNLVMSIVDEDDQPAPQPKTQLSKLVKETPLSKPYKPKIPYTQCLRKEKIEAQHRKFLDMIRAVRINVPHVDVLTGMPNNENFLEELISNKHKIEQILAAFLSDESSAILQNKVPPKLGDLESFLIPCNFNKTSSCNALANLGASINLMPYSLYAKISLKTLKPTKMRVILADRSFHYPVGIAKNMLVEVVIRVKHKQLNLGVGTERMIFSIHFAIKHSYSNDDTCFSIDVIDEILEKDFDALLDEGRKILNSIEGTVLEEEIFFEFDKFIPMASNENYDSESDEEELKFKKITINTDNKIKPSLEEPPTDLKLKPLPDNVEYVFLEESYFLLVIISSQLSAQNKSKLIYVLKNIKKHLPRKQHPSICPSFCKHKIQLLDDKKPVVQKQRRLNSNMQEVVKKEIMKLLDTDIIYPIADSPWVSPIHYVLKKGDITLLTNENDERVPTRTVTGWRVCIDYHKLNEATAKDHFPLPFMDQMLERLEKCHFMVKEGIVLGYKVSGVGLKVDRAKINVISKFPPLLTSKNIDGKFRNSTRFPPVIVIDLDDQPMWSSTRTVAPTPSFAIIQLHISNNFHIKGTYMQMIRDIQFDGRIRSDPHRHVADFLDISNLSLYGKNQEEAVILRTFPFSLFREAKTWLNELDEGTITS
uniref:Reverse transcriptase domain-containing protein n=1 Tax=Tanacetum cinerariifolium TaxID=118510 RepID=A0A6L2NVP2_TANCI|nr:reverse transcriptase domain-containing protein [Tanacetum cinerariifolium]